MGRNWAESEGLAVGFRGCQSAEESGEADNEKMQTMPASTDRADHLWILPMPISLIIPEGEPNMFTYL